MLDTNRMFGISRSLDMLEKLKAYTKAHREDADADKNVLICTKIALNLSNDFQGSVKEAEYKLFSEEEILKIEKVLNESKDKTKIYRTKNGQHYSLEPIHNNGKYCNEKECDIAGIYSIPEEFKISISAGRLRFDDGVYLVDNKGEPSIGLFKGADIEIIELKKVQIDVSKNKKTMRDIEKSLKDGKDNNRDIQKDKMKIKQVNDLCEEINVLNTIYQNSEEKFYFDYDGVIELLEKTKERIEKSLKCMRPDNIPSDMAWCEMTNPNFEFDPIVYDGSMSIEDFEKVQTIMSKKLKKGTKNNVTNNINKSLNNNDIER